MRELYRCLVHVSYCICRTSRNIVFIVFGFQIKLFSLLHIYLLHLISSLSVLTDPP